MNWGFGEVLWFRRATGPLGEALRAEAVRHTAVLQDWLSARLGDADWFGGTAFGWADAAAAPMINRSVHYGLGPPSGSALARWHRRVRERPSVAATFAEFDAAAARMAEAADLYTTGGRRREYRDLLQRGLRVCPPPRRSDAGRSRGTASVSRVPTGSRLARGVTGYSTR